MSKQGKSKPVRVPFVISGQRTLVSVVSGKVKFCCAQCSYRAESRETLRCHVESVHECQESAVRDEKDSLGSSPVHRPTRKASETTNVYITATSMQSHDQYHIYFPRIRISTPCPRHSGTEVSFSSFCIFPFVV